MFRKMTGGIIVVALSTVSFAVFAQEGNVSKSSVYPFAEEQTTTVRQVATKCPALEDEKLPFAERALEPYRCSTRLNIHQSIDLGGPGCYDGYRWWDDDVDVKFQDPQLLGCSLISARLCSRFCDVDFLDQSAANAELDVVQFGKSSIDVFKGTNGAWNSVCWDVKPELLQNIARTIPFKVNVDAANDRDFWAVTIDYAQLDTVWSCGRWVAVEDEIEGAMTVVE